MQKKYMILASVLVLFVLSAVAVFYLAEPAEVSPPVVVKNEKTERLGGTTAEEALAMEKRNIIGETGVDSNTPPMAHANTCRSVPYSEKLGCYDKFYRTIVLNDSVAAAFKDIRTRYDTDPFFKSECHQLTHVIGRTAAQKFGRVEEAFVNGDAFCWSGYYHGVMEGISQIKGLPNFKETINDICKNIPGKESFSFDYYNCVHGLGHGVMTLSYNNLFSSLALCDGLTGGWEQSSCWSGAFMENVIADGRDHKTTYLKPEDPLYPCNAVENRYKNTCYLMQTSYMLRVSGGNFSKVFELCRTVGDTYINTCYQSLGRDASGQSISDKGRTRATCLLGQDFREQSNCVIGAVKDFISYFHSDKEAYALCDSLSNELKDVCHPTVLSYYKAF